MFPQGQGAGTTMVIEWALSFALGLFTAFFLMVVFGIRPFRGRRVRAEDPFKGAIERLTRRVSSRPPRREKAHHAARGGGRGGVVVDKVQLRLDGQALDGLDARNHLHQDRKSTV